MKLKTGNWKLGALIICAAVALLAAARADIYNPPSTTMTNTVYITQTNAIPVTIAGMNISVTNALVVGQ